MSIEHDDPHLDLGYTSYDDAKELRRARLGKTSQSAVVRTVQKPQYRRHASRSAAVGPQYGEEANVGYPEGRPEDQRENKLSTEDAARTHHFTQNWREIAAEAVRNGTHAVEDD